MALGAENELPTAVEPMGLMAEFEVARDEHAYARRKRALLLVARLTFL
jgi:hypothetical protein